MAPESITLLAPAKLNLFLHITGRRADGYHELQTLFQLLDYGDKLTFESADAGVLSLHVSTTEMANVNASAESEAFPLDNNLILVAARKLLEISDNPLLGAKITLKKQIPMGAGLGGGSSDAAITLIALNQLWGLQLDENQLCAIGIKLGADVPVFIRGRSAWAEGIGEQLNPVELGDFWYLVACPQCSVSTREVFCHEQLTRNTQAIKMADFLAGSARNDCESVTRKLYPQVDQAIKCLSQFAETRMTGTGSSIFARFEDEAAARTVLKALPDSLPGFVAKGIDSIVYD
ncbi:MAG: 4-(cytidine 5'-diphospho)-2-C-methyl-D-erythritol kinase [SAR86 cluster bacterium]|uniref:4-diphosphocytidyl-2-C-methyl-D-erythritol kinase n=1 Tax=SAR86 cluster bacterium TaxID=2030880 RepID=A0A2A5B529_9GAMM|nr:MAG: 4-(cytidine 5'-diphospho)-2-C-methyl-D-erythritol kinase [SAR86 cluster bacterium]